MSLGNNIDLSKLSEKNFSTYYVEHIQPLANKYEQMRLSAIESAKYIAILAVPCSILLTILFYRLYLFGVVGEWIFWLWIFSIALIGAGVFSPTFHYRKSVKLDVYPLIIKYFGDTYRYIKQPTVTLFDFDDSRLFNYIEDTGISDQFTGEIHGVMFDIVHAVILEPRHTGRITDWLIDNKKPTIIFDGTCIILSMNKEFNGVTIFSRDKGGIGNLIFNQTKAGFAKIHLEDPRFESKFEVSSTDQVEARYLLTTSFMERLTALEAINQCGLFGSFYHGKLMLLMPNVKWVPEPQIRSRVTFIEESNLIIAQMKEICKIIEILNLKQNTRL
jgi:hypothetical protein